MKLKTLLLAAGTSLILCGGAYAADLPMAPEIEEAPVALGSGWYLRGDIGISTQNVDEMTNKGFDTTGTKIDWLDEPGFDSAPFFAFGVGYQVNKYLRFDVTGEYRGEASLHGADRYDFGAPGYDGANEYNATKSELVGLVNGYVDLVHWRGFTPYIGGGIGFTYTTIDHFRDTNVPNGGVAFADENSEFDLAYAAHAGIGYEVAPGLMIDLGYRYINLGDAETGTVEAYDGSGSFGKKKFEDIDSHDVKLGFRWAIDGDHRR